MQGVPKPHEVHHIIREPILVPEVLSTIRDQWCIKWRVYEYHMF